MPDHLVTGIAQTSDPAQLENTIGSHSAVDQNRLTVITKDSPTTAHRQSFLRFIHAGEPHPTTDVDHDVITGDVAILTDAGGVNVPGISADTRYLGFFAHPHVIDHFSGWPIPEDEVQNYNDAIEAGRSVVTYKAQTSEVPDAEQAFRDAGLRHVKTFDSKNDSVP